MARSRPRRACLFAALALPLVACDPNEITNDDPVVVTIEQGEAVALARRDEVDLIAVDQNGERVSGVTWSIVGADEFTPSVVTVSGLGRVTGRDIGSAFVRATAGESSDSIRVDVSVGELHEGEVHVVMTGDVEREYVLSEEVHFERFVGLQIEVLDRPDWGEAHFQAFGSPAGHPDTYPDVLLAVPDSFTVGTHTVGAYEAGTEFRRLVPGVDSAYARLDEGRIVVTAGSIEISAATSPGETPSGGTGSVKGTAALAADLYTREYDEDTQTHVFTPTGESVELAVAFHVGRVERWRGGWITATADGAGYVAESWDVVAGGFHDTVDGAGVLTPFDGEIVLAVGLPEPAVGPFSVETGQAWVYASVYVGDDCSGCDFLEAEATAGTVEVTEFTARTGATASAEHGPRTPTLLR